MKVLISAALAACALLAACGGGADEADGGREERATALRSLSATALADRRKDVRRASVLTAGAFQAERAAQLFALAESSYATYFPSQQKTRSFEDWAYRHYPETGIYLAVIGSSVYVLGGEFGPEAVRVGEIAQFIGEPPTGELRPLTAAILGQCPDASSSQAADFYRCMVGHLVGTQKFDRNRSCRLEISDDGVWTLSSDGKSVTVGPAYRSVLYAKTASLGLLFTMVTQPAGAFTAKIALSATGLSFANGGVVDVEGTPPGSSNASISCVLDVPR